jgi:hypothetical protein
MSQEGVRRSQDRKGAAMSRRKKYRTDGGFVMVSRQMTRSAAYRSLSPRAGWLLHGLMDHYEGSDNRIAMSRREGEAWLKTGSHKVAAAFAELQEKGFILCHERGGFSRKIRHATVWTLTMFGRGGQKATLGFLSWQGQSLVTGLESRKPQKSNHGCQRATNTGANAPPMDPPIGANAPPVSAILGCQRATNTGANAPPLIECTIESGGPKAASPAPVHNLPDSIKAGRIRRGWSQRDLAHSAQTHQPIVSQIERGDFRRVGHATIERVALAAGIGPRERIVAALKLQNGEDR